MINLLLKPTPLGERAYPVDVEELKLMEALDEIEKVSDRPLVYRVKTERPKEEEPEVEPQEYETKVMVASTRRRKSQ